MIKVAIVGIGNCCSALIQGLHYYRDKEDVPGLMFPKIGGYTINDIDVVAAFDVDKRKVGLPLGQAIFSLPNCARVFVEPTELQHYGPVVNKTPIMDGVADHLCNVEDKRYSFDVDEAQQVDDVGGILKAAKPDILINYLPVGSQEATEYIAQLCLEYGISFLNCIPVFIASEPEWEQKFIDAGIPIVGDDMRSQVGTSVLSQTYNELFLRRGANITHHVQENRGSNMDFWNMMDKSRVRSKKISKENVLRAGFLQNNRNLDKVVIYAGPSNFIPLHNDYKEGIFDIQAEGFGGAPIHLITHLKVCDSENSAGVVVDAIRYLKVARELGLKGSLRGPSAFTQKTPPVQLAFNEALEECRLLARRRIPSYMSPRTTLYQRIKNKVACLKLLTRS